MLTYARTFVLSTGLALAGLGVVTCAGESQVKAGPGKGAHERQPHIRQAIEELKEARKELKEADHDFNGHRKEALEAVNVAIVQLEKALKSDKK